MLWIQDQRNKEKWERETVIFRILGVRICSRRSPYSIQLNLLSILVKQTFQFSFHRRRSWSSVKFSHLHGAAELAEWRAAPQPACSKADVLPVCHTLWKETPHPEKHLSVRKLVDKISQVEFHCNDLNHKFDLLSDKIQSI